MRNKIVPLSEICIIADNERNKGRRIVQCHGVFDLLHPGHIKHFEEAKSLGHVLIVTVTPDKYVNKGPGRPAFNEVLRMESIAALTAVDYVVLNDCPDAVSCIYKLRPNIYVKGKEYENHDKDVTGKISEESDAVHQVGGSIYYTDGIVFSSSALLNQYFDPLPPKVESFMHKFKQKYTLQDLLEKCESLCTLKVLVIGDAILDEYQYVEALGQSGKGIHMVGLLKDKEMFIGGTLAIAKQLYQFCPNVTLLTALGHKCPHKQLIENLLPANIQRIFYDSVLPETLTKRRYIDKDGKNLAKLFETYTSNELILDNPSIEKIRKYLKEHEQEFDLILTCDFGNGFFEPKLMSTMSELNSFMTLNTQANSGNRGYNVATHYSRADLLSLNEPEARLTAQDRYSSLPVVMRKITKLMDCKHIVLTRGVLGVEYYENAVPVFQIPAVTTHAVDRVGAGDTLFAITSLCRAKGIEMDVSVFLGAVAAAMEIQIVGNKEPVKKIPMMKYLMRLMK